MKVVLFASALSALTLALPAVGLSIGNYQVDVVARDSSDENLTQDGWSCRTGTTLKYSEAHKTSQGAEQEVVQSTSQKQQLSFQFERDMNADNPKAEITLTETCKRHSSAPVTVTWHCPLQKKLPNYLQERVVAKCTPQTDTASPGPTSSHEDGLLAALSQKAWYARFTLSDRHFQWTKNLCDGNRNTSGVIIHLSGGVSGHTGEKAMVFHVDIDGKQKFDVPTDNGILNDDVLYCGAGDALHVKVTARTDHFLIKNRRYYGKDGSEELTFYKASPERTGVIRLFRKSLSGQETYGGLVSVDLIPPSQWTRRAAGESHDDTHGDP